MEIIFLKSNENTLAKVEINHSTSAELTLSNFQQSTADDFKKHFGQSIEIVYKST